MSDDDEGHGRLVIDMDTESGQSGAQSSPIKSRKGADTDVHMMEEGELPDDTESPSPSELKRDLGNHTSLKASSTPVKSNHSVGGVASGHKTGDIDNGHKNDHKQKPESGSPSKTRKNPSSSALKTMETHTTQSKENDAMDCDDKHNKSLKISKASGAVPARNFMSPPMKKNMVDKSTYVTTKACQVDESFLGLKPGTTACINITVMCKVGANTLYIVAKWRGKEYFGVLTDGEPAHSHLYYQKRNATANAEKNTDNSTSGVNASADRGTNAAASSKVRGKRGVGVRQANFGVSAEKKNRNTDPEDDDQQNSASSRSNNDDTSPSHSSSSSSPTKFGQFKHSELISDKSLIRRCPHRQCGHRFETIGDANTHMVISHGDAKAVMCEAVATQTDTTKSISTASDPCFASSPSSIDTKDVDVMNLCFKCKQQFGPSSSNETTQKSAEEESINELFKVARCEKKSGDQNAKSTNSPSAFSDISDDGAPTLEKEESFEKSQNTVNSAADRKKLPVNEPVNVLTPAIATSGPTLDILSPVLSSAPSPHKEQFKSEPHIQKMENGSELSSSLLAVPVSGRKSSGDLTILNPASLTPSSSTKSPSERLQQPIATISQIATIQHPEGNLCNSAQSDSQMLPSTSATVPEPANILASGPLMPANLVTQPNMMSNSPNFAASLPISGQGMTANSAANLFNQLQAAHLLYGVSSPQQQQQQIIASQMAAFAAAQGQPSISGAPASAARMASPLGPPAQLQQIANSSPFAALSLNGALPTSAIINPGVLTQQPGSSASGASGSLSTGRAHPETPQNQAEALFHQQRQHKLYELKQWPQQSSGGTQQQQQPSTSANTQLTVPGGAGDSGRLSTSSLTASAGSGGSFGLDSATTLRPSSALPLAAGSPSIIPTTASQQQKMSLGPQSFMTRGLTTVPSPSTSSASGMPMVMQIQANLAQQQQQRAFLQQQQLQQQMNQVPITSLGTTSDHLNSLMQYAMFGSNSQILQQIAAAASASGQQPLLNQPTNTASARNPVLHPPPKSAALLIFIGSMIGLTAQTYYIVDQYFQDHVIISSTQNKLEIFPVPLNYNFIPRSLLRKVKVPFYEVCGGTQYAYINSTEVHEKLQGKHVKECMYTVSLVEYACRLRCKWTSSGFCIEIYVRSQSDPLTDSPKVPLVGAPHMIVEQDSYNVIEIVELLKIEHPDAKQSSKSYESCLWDYYSNISQTINCTDEVYANMYAEKEADYIDITYNISQCSLEKANKAMKNCISDPKFTRQEVESAISNDDVDEETKRINFITGIHETDLVVMMRDVIARDTVYSPKAEYWKLMSELGGTLSLYVGFTVMSLLEAIAFFAVPQVRKDALQITSLSMALIKSRWMWLLLGALLFTSQLCPMVSADEDAADGEVTDEGDSEPADEEPTQNTGDSSKDIPTDTAGGASPDAHVSFLFTSKTPDPSTKELVAGQLVKFLVGFANHGEKDFIVKASEASFRYHMDYSYHIQNFSAVRYERTVQPKQEATFDYAFIPSEQYIGRPMGLVINLHYADADGSFYTHAIFNETVNIVEDESAFSTETGFLYVVLAGLGVLILLIGQHYLSKLTRKQASSSSYQPSAQEIGTNKNEVDYEWIPRTHFLEKKSPKAGHQSPKSGHRRPVKAT
ncbi:translocon-associated protein (TRAP), alpha subunit domain-containing protein [Ditylenchus destructor]|nr:translocon-associated protein (TRAP), alpha subunit domain-containing protein [Ditylenchus destructor]